MEEGRRKEKREERMEGSTGQPSGWERGGGGELDEEGGGLGVLDAMMGGSV